MEWRDQGILLAVRKHGETSAILEVFTPTHGIHAGVMRGATSRKIAPILQPGAQLDVQWRARLEDHIGSYSVEPLRSRAAMVMQDRQALAGLNAVCALLVHSLPEREPHPALYERTEALFDILDETELWPLAYLRWEVALLEELGYGLDLDECAVTGKTQDLIYVSPKTRPCRIARRGGGLGRPDAAAAFCAEGRAGPGSAGGGSGAAHNGTFPTEISGLWHPGATPARSTAAVY